MNVPKQPEVKGYWQRGHQLCKGKYTIEKDLGSGGFGVTYLARDKKSQQVVIKTLNQDVQVHPLFEKLRQDFLNEAIRLAKCSHHHIVEIIELFEENFLPCIVMEYIPGEDLATWVEKRNLEEAEAIFYIRQIGEALDTVHQQGLLHRDVKPKNIIITVDGSSAILIDFGIARDYRQRNLTTQITFVSEGYSPIEQYYPQERQAPYTDVYSLAATLYFALTGKSPQYSQRRHYNLTRYGNDPLFAPKKINPNISEEVNTVILQGMALAPENRLQTIKNWLDLLPDVKNLPKKKLNNYVYYKATSQTTLPINPLYRMLRYVNKQFFLSSGKFVVAIFLILIPSVYLTKNSHFYRKYISSIFVNEESLIYKNNNYSFELEYPHNWRLSQHRSQDFTKIVAELLAPNSDSSHGALAKIVVEVRSLETARSLTDVKQETVKEIQQWFDNSEILENGETYLAGREAYLLVYEGTDGGRKIRRMRVATVKNNREYALIYEADLSHYEMQKNLHNKLSILLIG